MTKEWYPENVNDWYPAQFGFLDDPDDPDYNDEGYFDQPPSDIYHRMLTEFFREKIEEFVYLIGGFYLQTMIEAA